MKLHDDVVQQVHHLLKSVDARIDDSQIAGDGVDLGHVGRQLGERRRHERRELASNRVDDVIDLTAITEIGQPIDADAGSSSAVGAVPHRRVDDLVADAREPVVRVRPRRTGGWKPVRSTTPPPHDTDD